LGIILIGPGSALTSFCCATTGSSTDGLCSWYGPFLILAGIGFAASIPLTVYAVHQAQDRQGPFLKRHLTHILPWCFMIIILVCMIAGFSAKVPNSSDLSPEETDQCTNQASQLLDFLQSAHGKVENITNADNTTSLNNQVTLGDALSTERASFVGSGVLALFLAIILIASSYRELAGLCSGLSFDTGMVRSLNQALVRGRGSEPRRSSQSDIREVPGAEMKEMSVLESSPIPLHLRDGRETVNVKVVTRDGTRDLVDVENIPITNLRSLLSVKELEERISYLPILIQRGPTQFTLEFRGEKMVPENRVSSYNGAFARRHQVIDASNQIIVVRSPTV